MTTLVIATACTSQPNKGKSVLAKKAEKSTMLFSFSLLRLNKVVSEEGSSYNSTPFARSAPCNFIHGAAIAPSRSVRTGVRTED